MVDDGGRLHVRKLAPLEVRDGGDRGAGVQVHEASGVFVGQDVQRVHHRRSGERLQRQTPQIPVAVHHVEAARLGHGLGHVLPLAHLPVLGGAVGAVGVGQGGDQLAVRGRTGGPEHGDLMAPVDETLGEVPHDGLDAAAAQPADGSGEGGDLGYAHEREPTTAAQSA